jgi:glyoxylase-like metal-dependent hydrolase (beta-lactamase superfamily II)
MAEHFGCPVYAGAKDAEAIRSADPDLTLSWRMGIDILPIPCESVTEGYRFDSGEGAFTVLETPGHTPGGICLYNQDTGELISGDTVFADGYGRTDLPGGDMYAELDSLRRLCLLEGDFEVYPGHMDSSTLARERMFNYYCRAALSR